MRYAKTLTMAAWCTLAALSCGKAPVDNRTPEEKQAQAEETQALAGNEILDRHGLRFNLTVAPTDTNQVNIALSLHHESGAVIPFIIDGPAHRVFADSMPNNSTFILVAHVKKAIVSGSYKVDAVGYTTPAGRVDYSMSKNVSAVDNATRRNLVKIKKGINLYTLTPL